LDIIIRLTKSSPPKNGVTHVVSGSRTILIQEGLRLVSEKVVQRKHNCAFCKVAIDSGEKIGGRVQSKPSDIWVDRYICVSCYKILWDKIDYEKGYL